MINESSTTPDPRDLKRYYFHDTRTRRATVAIMKFMAWFVMKYEFHGSENLPEEGAAVLVSNHVTNFDVFPMQISIQRPIFYMAKEELMRNPVMEYVLRKGGAFPVHRKSKDPWAKRHAQKVLEHGQVLGIFPEGTRSRGLGLRAAKTGAARFAIQANCPIVPMAINGSQRVLKSFPRRTLVVVKIGAPLYPQTNEGALALTDRLMFAIADMLPKELKGVYAVAPHGFETQLT
jgi:1-acyl-sn-glycerol-3-phosphate acyltransferase